MIALETKGLVKRFGDVIANKGISLKVKKGSIHGIVGENGAGKSTLLNMLFGYYTPDEGELFVKGKRQHYEGAADALKAGVGMVHQHFMLVDTFTVLENIILGAEEGRNLKKALDGARPKLEALDIKYGFGLNPDAIVEQMSVGECQRLEIVKALYRGAEVLILDEPTAVLTPQECDGLFALLKDLAAEGTTILFVTHKLHEIKAITDQVTVIRAGEVVANMATADVTAEQLAEAMVGAKIVRQVDRSQIDKNLPIRLSASNINARDDFGRETLKEVSLFVRAGEVLGIAGVAGNGQTELIDVLTGLRQVTAGQVQLDGLTVNCRSSFKDAGQLRAMGLAHIAEDRLKDGVVADMSAYENVMLGYHTGAPFARKNGLLNFDAIAYEAERVFDKQDVRPNNPSLPVGAFSGGNQQKIVIARELARSPEVLVIGQPTRGVDIGAVTLIHDQIMALRNKGKAILLVSADLDELLALSDHIAVMCEGEMVGSVPAKDATPTQLGLMMAGDASVASEAADTKTGKRGG